MKRRIERRDATPGCVRPATYQPADSNTICRTHRGVASLRPIRFSLLLLPLALLAASCSSDEPAARGGDAGAMRFAAAEASSRATTAPFSTFTLYGWQMANQDPDGNPRNLLLFDGQQVNRQPAANGQDKWVYNPLQYWFSGYNYHFEALASCLGPTDRQLTSPRSGLTITPPEQYRDEFTFGFDATASGYTEDVMYANAQRSTTEEISSKPVPFSFSHALARLKLRVKATEIKGCYLELNGITFQPKHKGCTFRSAPVGTTTQTPPDTPDGQPTTVTTYSLRLGVASVTPSALSDTITIPATNSTGTHSDGLNVSYYPYFDKYDPSPAPYFYLVPGEVGTIRVSFSLMNKSSMSKLSHYTTVYTIAGDMLPGHSYQATILLPSSTTVISLDGVLDDWGADNDTDREILYI